MSTDVTMRGHGASPLRQRPRRRIWLILGGILIISALVLAVTWWNESRRTDLNSLMNSPIVQDIHPVDVTDEHCSRLNCVSAWDTDVGRYVQFVHEGNAQHWQQILGDDSRRDGHVLLDMSEKDLNRDQIALAVDTLFINRDWT